jgi:hypothetical protein
MVYRQQVLYVQDAHGSRDTGLPDWCFVCIHLESGDYLSARENSFLPNAFQFIIHNNHHHLQRFRPFGLFRSPGEAN